MNTSQPTYDDLLILMKELFVSQKDTDRKFQETDRKFQDTDREIKAVTASVGRLSNRLGEFVEEAVRPAAVRLFQQCGIEVHEVQQNIWVKRDGEALEIDLLVVNDKDTVAIECKSNLSVDDVNEHLERLGKIKRLICDCAKWWSFGTIQSGNLRTESLVTDNQARNQTLRYPRELPVLFYKVL